jgi:hypothetical protein
MKKLSLVFYILITFTGYAQTGIDLTKWELWGIGKIEIDIKENAFKLVEGNKSKGVVLLSPEKYSKDVYISFDVKPLQFEVVCIVFISATDSNRKSVTAPENYDGNSDFWTSSKSGVKSYAVAFHTGYHQPNIFIKKNPGWNSLGEIKDVATAEQWYKIDIIKKNNLITLKINGNIVLESKDESGEFLKKGQIGLRLRGTGNGSSSILFNNLIILR